MLIKWPVIWGMEYSMAFGMFTPLISRKSRRRGGTGVRGRAPLVSISIKKEEKRKIVTFRLVCEGDA